MSPSTYTNPILNEDFPDPTIIQAADGYYYAYGTQTKYRGTIINMQVARSHNLIDWELLGDALPQKPAWADATQKLWAPHVSEHDGRYYLYFSALPNGSADGLCLAVAVANAPAGPFVDVGQPLLCGESFINIDPMSFDDPATGKRLLYWGSGFGPIKVRELAPDRISFAPQSEALDLIQPVTDEAPTNYQRLIEGAWVVLRAGWYYLFYSGNNCCGPDAHYGVLVARSRSAMGPFETLPEVTGNPNSMLLEGNDHWRAPGHNSVVTDAAGQDWLAYHAIDPKQPVFDAIDADQGYSRRVMLLDRLEYQNGWPRLVSGGTPSWQAQPAPVTRRL